MILINVLTGEQHQGIIESVSTSELYDKTNTSNFGFDWSEEVHNDVYKIRIDGESEILGLISLIDVSRELRIHINLIESSLENQGVDKKIDNIAGCMISFACKMATNKGYDGFVSLESKTELEAHYQNNYGFVRVGRFLAVFMEASDLLISKYRIDG